MALIETGSLRDFSVKPKESVLKQKPFLKSVKTFNILKEVTKTLAPDAFELITSTDQRGVALKSILLKEDFEGILANVFNPVNEVYFVAWSWDLSGQPVVQYPGVNFAPENVIIRLKSGKLREFIGEGINLFPKRKVTGGIAIRIQIWESDQDTRNFGKILSETADTIQKSELGQLLSLISLASGVSGATIALIEKASIELAKLIGTVLKANSDDYVDFFEGYYPSDKDWKVGEDSYEGNSSKIFLSKY
jgi:hypothetical protein